MKLIYNNLDLATLGELGIVQGREAEGGEQAQRMRVRLAVKLSLFERSYDENRRAVEALRAALALPNAPLQWVNDAVGVDYVNQTAVLVSEDLPEEWGEYHQTVNLVFSYYEQTPAGAANNLPLTFCAAGGQPLALGSVNRWAHAAAVERFSPLRPHRKEVRGRIRVEGQYFGDTTAALADRRAALAAAAAAFAEQLPSAEGRLVFGAGGAVFDGTVRVEDFTCDLDQLINAVNYSFTAGYTVFPDEAAYATAEFTTAEKDDHTGQLTLTAGGKIQAATEAAARVKLAAILAQVVSDHGYEGGQALAEESAPNTISANADGDTFTELNFTASWRKWKPTNQPATLRSRSPAGVDLGHVARWVDRVDTTRFSPLRKQRQQTAGGIEAAGCWSADLALTLTDRRAQLLARQRALKAEAAAAEAALTYGDWSQTVRVTGFTAEINQAETGIEWSLSASYTLFPNEASYATAEYTAGESDNFTGEVRLTVAGRVQAQSEAAAQAKVAAVLAAQLASRGYSAGQQLALDTVPNAIEADADGATFTELAFTANYRRWKATNQKATFGTPAVPLGNVMKWHDRVSVTRFNPLRSLRDRATDNIEAAGCWTAPAALSLTDRRAALLTQQRALKAAINVPDGRLAYGDWSQTVRVTDFAAEINQAETGIEWTLAATYNLFPNESSYTTTEWQADEKDNFSGETTLTLSGRIQAATEALARAKLAALTATVTAQRGYATGQQLALDTTASSLSTADGDTFTELAFAGTWRQWKSTNQAATFRRTGGRAAALGLGQVNRWRDHYAAQRFSEQRSQRRHATGSVEASGTLAGDGSLPVAARRAALLAKQRALKAEVNSADGLLTYGDWSQTVRVEDFQAEINQAETGIEWSLSASYSLFPNEGGYATAEFAVALRESVEEGDESMSFSGKIGAPTAALGQAKLNSLRAAVLASYGWTVAQRLRDESNLQSVYANGDATSGVADAADGTTFLELTFAEEYRRRITGALVGSTLQVTSREDVPAQTVQTTYAGTVTATGPTADAAYATALARAQALGANRAAAIDATAFLRGSSVSFEQRQVTQASVTEFVRLTFSYEYQSKLAAGRSYLELTTSTARDTFGVDLETCSGSVTARDAATAAAVYQAQVRGLYAGRLIHSEQTGLQESRNQAGDGYNVQHQRLEFSLQVFTPKQGVGLKYSVEVTRDFLTLELRTAVSGSCYAANRALADAAVGALLAAMNFGASLRSRRVEDREAAGALAAMLKLDFSEDFLGRVTGQAGVNEMKLTEKVVYSGVRWAVQALPFNDAGDGGVSIPQPSGVEPGSRVVSGSVTAGTRATAEIWAKKQRALLTGDKAGGSYVQPEQWEAEYVLVPRIDGIVTGAGTNVQLYRISFQFSELLPLYPAPL